MEIGWNNVIEPDVWEPVGDGSGYMHYVRQRTVGEVYNDLADSLELGGYHEHELCDEGFGIFPTVDAGQDWPKGRIVVFSVNGSSEGDYVHVEVNPGDGPNQLLMLGKHLGGRDEAWQFARLVADLLAA